MRKNRINYYLIIIGLLLPGTSYASNFAGFIEMFLFWFIVYPAMFIEFLVVIYMLVKKKFYSKKALIKINKITISTAILGWLIFLSLILSVGYGEDVEWVLFWLIAGCIFTVLPPNFEFYIFNKKREK